MVLVETEVSYTRQIILDSLDVRVCQFYLILVTADHKEADYYIVATPKMLSTTDDNSHVGKGALHYANSNTPVTWPLPSGPYPSELKQIDRKQFIGLWHESNSFGLTVLHTYI